MPHLILAFLLSPLLLLQALWVRVTVPKLEEADGKREGSNGQQKSRFKLVILGDSAAAGVGVDHQLQALSGNVVSQLSAQFCFQWQLLASSGATTRSTIDRLNLLTPQVFDVVVISLGVNDVLSLTSATQWICQQQALFDLLRSKFAAKLIVLTAIPKMEKFPALPQPLGWLLGVRANQFNQQLKIVCDNQADCRWLTVDMTEMNHLIASDGFHPGAKGYQLWGKQVAEAIKHYH